MDTVQKLVALFEEFPGIGPRQAMRFVQFLLHTSPSLRKDLAAALADLSTAVRQCVSCMRYSAGKEMACSICRDERRDQSLLCVIIHDTDITAMERSGIYKGKYFVLGATIALASEKNSTMRLNELSRHVKSAAYKEVILAFPASPEGDLTATKVQQKISEEIPDLKVSILGRGLSSGTELEYADTDTLKAALNGRKQLE